MLTHIAAGWENGGRDSPRSALVKASLAKHRERSGTTYLAGFVRLTKTRVADEAS